jgi:hypothetical protein
MRWELHVKNAQKLELTLENVEGSRERFHTPLRTSLTSQDNISATHSE